MLKKIVITLFIIGFAFCSGSETKNENKTTEKVADKGNELKLKKVLMVIANRNFQDTEFRVPHDKLKEAGADITVASSSMREAVGMNKKERVKPQMLLSRVNANNFDVIIFVGGSGATEYFKSAAAKKLAKRAYKKNKVVAAICIAPRILAEAGVLKGKNATSFKSQLKRIHRRGAKVITDKDVVVDGNIITANGPSAADQFAEKILEKMK